MASGSELRLAPPPDATESQAELVQLQELALRRDGAAVDRINYWDASTPSYRWTQRAVKHTQARGVLGNRAVGMLASSRGATVKELRAAIGLTRERLEAAYACIRCSG